MKSVRIFVSSPGDVGTEREKAREIFERLPVKFSGLLKIEPHFWERAAASGVKSPSHQFVYEILGIPQLQSHR